MLTGIIKPTSGSAQVLGFDPVHATNDFKRQFALVMGQKSQLWWDLPAVETFRLNQAIYEIPESDYQHTVQRLTEMFTVTDLLKIPVRQLSLGERMKMEIITSLLHNPRVLFLDEPTIGLDAIAQRQIRELLQQINREQNVAILLTSHYMKDIRSLCKRVIVIRQGQKLYDGALDTLLESYKETVNVHLRFAVSTDWNPNSEVTRTQWEALNATYQVPQNTVQTFLHQALNECQISDVRIEEKELDEMVEQIYTMEGEQR